MRHTSGEVGNFSRAQLIAATQFQQQADAVLNQANPVSGTLYEVLATTTNVRIESIGLYVTWTVQPTPLELHITIDGVVCTFAFANPVSNSWYFPYFWDGTGAAANQALTATPYSHYQNGMLEGRSVRIQVETTGGTVQALYCRVKYATRS